MASDYYSTMNVDADAGQTKPSEMAYEQPEAHLVAETWSTNTEDCIDNLEAWALGTEIKITSYKRKSDVARKQVDITYLCSEQKLTFHLSQNLPFVAETGTARPKGSSRTLIRSHARRRPGTKAKVPSQLIAILPQNDCSPTKDESDRSLLRTSQPQLSSFPRKASVDPFQALPISDVGNSQFYIHYYDSDFSESFSPVNPRKAYLPFVITDAALLHATLSHSSIRHNMLRGVPGADPAYHNAKAVQIVNERLRKPVPECTDATITAVACLALFEWFFPPKATHRSSIKCEPTYGRSRSNGEDTRWHQVYQTRESCKKTYNMVNHLTPTSQYTSKVHTRRIDSCASIFLETPARFALILEADEEDPTSWYPYSPLASTYLSTLITHTCLPALSTSLIVIYWGIHNVTLLKEVTSRLSRPPEILSYSDMVERLERRIVDVIQSPSLKNNINADTAILSLFANAALVHIYAFMRDLPLGIVFLATLSRRIRGTLDGLTMGGRMELGVLYPELWVWVLVMAGIGGVRTDERMFFAGLARDFCDGLEIRGADGVESFLKGWLWCEMYRASNTEAFWKDFREAGENEECSGDSGVEGREKMSE
ncbi:hypothetical protein VTL71DRAFT_11956 [Oculimacula yallundae]|uniref:Uncharacterized protein n=1 Tax=Oculimacula yallundae TaxID=86028 RepID=A0ABR4CS87_9HELO